ncbi:MAG TPA: hypothetical protein VG147_00635 [Solirubrobacteraceae bacterium]|jgi:hypothetical protein|nr:hypothetical protein [Solirubrobacteraceae bacterium]
MPRDRAHAPVGFDEAVWKEDLRSSTDAGRTAAASKRAELERDGQPIDELLACDTEAQDGTSLPNCVKTYVPWPDGKWGIVYLIARDPNTGRLSLDVLSFGVRHHPQGSHAPTVYERAHRRMHGQPPRR